MNKSHLAALPLAGAVLLGGAARAVADETPALERADLEHTNRIVVSARFGLDVRPKFSGIGLPAAGAANGYFDGYVVTASPPNLSPNPDYTTYWGYNNSSQLLAAPGGYSGVAFHTPTAAGGTGSDGGGDVSTGFEVAYLRQLFEREDWHHLRFGVEGAFNFMPFSANDQSAFAVNVSQTDYSFPIAIAAPPPFADNGGPGQPALHVPGTPGPGSSGALTVQDHFDGNLWGIRLGPYAELPATDNFSLRLSGGLAAGLVQGDETWRETISGLGSASGGGNDTSVLWGFYLGLAADYQISRHWGVDVGVQFQDLGTYSHNFGGRTAQLDLGGSFFLQAGISYSF